MVGGAGDLLLSGSRTHQETPATKSSSFGQHAGSDAAADRASGGVADLYDAASDRCDCEGAGNVVGSGQSTAQPRVELGAQPASGGVADGRFFAAVAARCGKNRCVYRQ